MSKRRRHVDGHLHLTYHRGVNADPGFEADEHLLDLLMGEHVYSHPSSCVRELLQNADDACQLQGVLDPAFSPVITVTYSPTQNWLDVDDNGLGMNEETFNLSFRRVGAPKGEVEAISQILEKAPDGFQQIAAFGIGILSCFQVAQEVLVTAKMDSFDGLAYRITGVHDPFQKVSESRETRGTSVRIALRSDVDFSATDVPGAVSNYARHVPHLEVRNADDGTTQVITDEWQGSDSAELTDLASERIRKGVLGVADGWLDSEEVLISRLRVTNGGFLLSENATNLVPQPICGYSGEIDLVPGAVKLNISRESAAEDENWHAVGAELAEAMDTLLCSHLKSAVAQGKSYPQRALERNVILLGRALNMTEQLPMTCELAKNLIPRVVTLGVWGPRSGPRRRVTIDEAMKQVGAESALYVLRENAGGRTISSKETPGSGQIDVQETVQTMDIRAALIRARGDLVLTTNLRSFGYELGGRAQKTNLDEWDLLNTAASESGIRILDISQVPGGELLRKGSAESELLTHVLDIAEPLKLMKLPESTEEIIRDFDGRLLNTAHPDVRQLLKQLPDILTNPARTELLRVYFELLQYRSVAARKRLRALLLDGEFSARAQLHTYPLLSEYLRQQLASFDGSASV